ncbi:hypothetical protein [Geotalea sp. SG265]|uniref:hypothetical protein n=1 Tax=Geotalea sp. SG265 TaxID=2922867 RepID=UPI001FAEB0D9|nr:hypothetical protein [Geotalea sp. SG265]
MTLDEALDKYGDVVLLNRHKLGEHHYLFNSNRDPDGLVCFLDLKTRGADSLIDGIALSSISTLTYRVVANEIANPTRQYLYSYVEIRIARGLGEDMGSIFNYEFQGSNIFSFPGKTKKSTKGKGRV